MNRKLAAAFLVGVVAGAVLSGVFFSAYLTQTQGLWVRLHVLVLSPNADPSGLHPVGGRIVKGSETRDYLRPYAGSSGSVISDDTWYFRVQLTTRTLDGETISFTVLPQCREGYVVQLRMSDEGTTHDSFTTDYHAQFAPLCVVEQHWDYMLPLYAEVIAGT